MTRTHLDRLEAEAIHILREAVAEAERPVLMYSVGKDSAAMLHCALKAFAPGRLPFPVLHVASGWDFADVLAHRDRIVAQHGLQLIVARSDDALNPFTTPTPEYTRRMLTEPLKRALTEGRFDAIFGGGRRDEDRARAKERIASFRGPDHGWNPRAQRPEPWQLLNLRVHRGESVRLFPLSNWTESDVWAYVARENVPVPPLYLARPRPVFERDGALLVADDDRVQLRPGEVVEERSIRFRTLGCWPLTGGHLSAAATIPEVIAELALDRQSERSGRLVDVDQSASMERKKAEGYF